MTVRKLNWIHVITVFKKKNYYDVISAHNQIKTCSLLKVLINHAFLFSKEGKLVATDLAGILIPHRLGNRLQWSQIRSGFDRKSYQTDQTFQDKTNADCTWSFCENKHQTTSTGLTRWSNKAPQPLDVSYICSTFYFSVWKLFFWYAHYHLKVWGL